mgnify:CR=1 FL=1
MNAMAAPDADRILVFLRPALQRGKQAIDIGNENVGGPHQLDIEAGVEHVRRGHALVDESRFGTDVLGEVREKRDDVVPGDGLDLVDAGDVENSFGAFLPNCFGSLIWDDANPGAGGGGMSLDFKPNAKPRCRLPDLDHFGTGIARDHAD